MGLCLLLLIVLPLLGAAVAAVVKPAAARSVALAFGGLSSAAAVVLAFGFNFHQDLASVSADQRLEQSVQLQFPQPSTNLDAPPMTLVETGLGLSFHLGADSISLWLVLLTALTVPLALIANSGVAPARQKEYYAWMLVLLAALNGAFLARDLLLFYIFFELTLVPSFFLIGMAGGSERRHAAAKFFLYTFAGSVLMLGGVIYVGVACSTFDLSFVTQHVASILPHGARLLIVWSLLAGFAVKVPLFPLHTWQAGAYGEAPAPSSAILAGILAKLGTYGFLRLILPLGLVADGGVAFPSLVRWLAVACIIGILYAALIAWVQRDMKKLLAFSSFSHLGFCILGLMALNLIGLQGATLYMINHGLSTVALFLCVGMIIQRVRTRDMQQFSGLAAAMPRLAFFFVLFMLSSIGLPGLNGFVSEFLTILAAFTSAYLGIGFGVLAALGVILGALYMLHMTARVLFGPLRLPTTPDLAEVTGSSDLLTPVTHVTDLSAREVGLLVPLAIAVVLLGVMPNVILNSIKPALSLIQPAPMGMTSADQPASTHGDVLANAATPPER